MTYWRTARLASGAQPPAGPHHGRYAPRGDINKYFPPQSILADPTDPPLERSEITQSLIDVGAVFFAFLFVSLTALAIVGAIGILFFV